MLRKFLALSILLTLIFSCGSANETISATQLYDDEPLNQIQHKVAQLSSDNEKIWIRLENLKDHLDKQSEDLREIKAYISANQKTSVTSAGFDTVIKSLDSRMVANDERLGHLTQVLNEVKKRLSANEGRANITAYATSCLDLSEGVQPIRNDRFSPRPFNVLCDNSTHGGGWTVIQRRLNGAVDFYRNLADYKCGFGDLGGEFFIGLKKLHALTNACVNELLIVMRDDRNVERFAKYDAFAIGDECEGYALNILGNYSGDAGDSLQTSRLQRFYTKDNDNSLPCAEQLQGAWWYPSDCGFSNLNGKYGKYDYYAKGSGIYWVGFRGIYDYLPYVKMLIRPKGPCSL